MDKQPVFLLGGRDLEMCVIADMLRAQRITFKDYSLQWDNAHLSQYQTELQEYGNHAFFQIYGVELQEDIIPPTNYIRIDHHNDFIDKPSALEQVANLLNVSLNRYQQLVVINDRAYIPGLQAAGATSDEIAQIRYNDRKAQGVTKEEEQWAELAINENREQIGDLIIIHAFCSHFSPICDRLYPYEKLLIYTDEELMYYGKGVNQLIVLFGSEIFSNQFFYGGGENGYIGIVRNSCSFQQLQKFINKIKQYEYDL